MNFFEHQERAKKRTSLLVIYFALAVIGIVAAVNIALVTLFFSNNFKLVQPEFYLWTSGITLLIILLGTIFGMEKLGKDGGVIAKALGGVRVNPATQDAAERKLVNIVEEMSIASGIPVPPIYILPDNSINAFAAGLTPNTAAIAVTNGTIQTLDRDELQGVIAHEFSHIFNGDMRLNLRLIGLLNGILMLAIIGRILARTRGKKNPLPLVGLVLIVIGYIGVFMSRLIKNAVSRQREFLADASAVQFTRNPPGLRDALVKIKKGASIVKHPKAEEVSHLFFAQGFATSWTSLFATHPPLDERIRAIDSTFRGEAAQVTRPSTHKAEPALEGVAALSEPMSAPVTPTSVTASVASPLQIDLSQAVAFRISIPKTIATWLTETENAKAVIYAMLLSENKNVRERQHEILESADRGCVAQVDAARQFLDQAKITLRLPLIEIATPALRLLPKTAVNPFVDTVQRLIRADNRVTPFEFAIELFLEQLLEANLGGLHAPRKNTRSSAMCVLSYLAYAGAPTNQLAAQQAFEKGYKEIDLTSSKALLPWETCGPNDVRLALIDLADSTPNEKKNIVAALTACIAADGTVTPEEWETLRAFCSVLDCPMPFHPPS